MAVVVIEVAVIVIEVAVVVMEVAVDVIEVGVVVMEMAAVAHSHEKLVIRAGTASCMTSQSKKCRLSEP